MTGQRTVCAGWGIAVGRFRPDGPIGYRAASRLHDGHLWPTRAEAVAEELAIRERTTTGVIT